MKGERRHELKEDEFAATIAEWGEWLEKNYKPLLVGACLIAVAVALVGWYVVSSRRASEEAWYSLAKADKEWSPIRMLLMRPGLDAKTVAEIEKIRQEMVERYKTIADNFPGTQAAALASCRAGDLLYDQRKYDEAIAQYQRVIRQCATGVFAEVASHALAYALEEKGQWDEAAEQFARTAGLTDGAQAAEARLDQARCLAKAGRAAAAADAYRKAMSLAPETEWAAKAQKAIEALEREKAAPSGAPGAGKPLGQKPTEKPKETPSAP